MALIGAFAKKPRFQGAGSSQVRPTQVDTLFDALSEHIDSLVYAEGFDAKHSELNQGLIDDFFYSDAGTGTEFWAECGWESGGKQLWKYIKSHKPQILSACPSVCNQDKKVIKGKTLWCKKNLGIPKSQVNIVQRKEKQNYAGKDIILIDDHKKNIREWENKGGIGIRHTDVAKTIGELKRLGFK